MIKGIPVTNKITRLTGRPILDTSARAPERLSEPPGLRVFKEMKNIIQAIETKTAITSSRCLPRNCRTVIHV
jgi:hypothetical protein